MEASSLQQARTAGVARSPRLLLRARGSRWLALATGTGAIATGLTIALLGATDGGAGGDIYDGCYLLLLALGGTSCLVRGFEGSTERVAWLAMGAGLWVWCGGEVLGAVVPATSAAVVDGTYLGFYLCAGFAVVMLVHAEGSRAPRDLIDAAMALAGLAALWAWLVLQHVVAGREEPLSVVELASPVADLALAALALGAVQRLGWRPSSRWLLISGAFLAIAVADSFYLVAMAAGTYSPGALYDFLWPIGALALGLAAWLGPQREDFRLPESFSLLAAVAAILAALTVVVVDQFEPVGLLAILLAALTGVLTIVRVGLTHARQLSTEASLRTEAMRTVEALATAVDAKDRYTRYHSDHVSLYARAIGERLNLPADRVDRLAVAGRLHDVGKIAVPDAVLLKAGRLTEEEWRVMRTHAAEGERIVRNIGLLDLAPWIRHHHERWDGGGYPDGLYAEQSPLEARILAGADSLDAMTASRSYRAPLSLEDARAEILAKAGTQFDPTVAHAIVALIDDGLCADAALTTPPEPGLVLV